MDVPELTNFGSLVRYAIELEAATAAFYQTAVRLLGPGEAASLALQLSQEHEARRSLLERTRQQKLNEMVLEPISGLDGSRYVADTDAQALADVRPKSIALEETAGRLYAESAEVAGSLLTEAARTFRKLGAENAKNASRLRETLHP